MRLGSSPGIALQAVELDGLSGRVALCRSVPATDGSLNGSLRPTVGAGVMARCVSGAGHNPAIRLRRLRDGDILEDGDVVLVRGG